MNKLELKEDPEDLEFEKKDNLYLETIRRINNFENDRNQIIDNKNMNLINIAGIFLSTDSILLGILASISSIPLWLQIFLLINILIF